MRAELRNKQGERITVCDNSTFDRYITDGWSVLSIFTERQENGKTSTDEKSANKTGQKGRKKTMLPNN